MTKFDEFLDAAFKSGKNKQGLLFNCPLHGLVKPSLDCPEEKRWMEAVDKFFSAYNKEKVGKK